MYLDVEKAYDPLEDITTQAWGRRTLSVPVFIVLRECQAPLDLSKFVVQASRARDAVGCLATWRQGPGSAQRERAAFQTQAGEHWNMSVLEAKRHGAAGWGEVFQPPT